MEPTVVLKDLGLVCALISKGHQVQETHREPDGHIDFVFSNSQGLQENIKAYWADTLVVKARTYSENLKMLKSRVYSER